MKFYRKSHSKVFPLILICSISSILAGLTIPIATAPGPVTFSVGTWYRYIPADLTNVVVDVNIDSPADVAIISWVVSIKVNPDVLELGYDYGVVVHATANVAGHFIYDYAIPGGWTVNWFPGMANSLTGEVAYASSTIQNWDSAPPTGVPQGQGANGTGKLVSFHFTAKNTSAAYSPILITEAFYYTSKNKPAQDEHVPDVINDGDYGTPIRDVAITSVAPDVPSVKKGSMVTISVSAYNPGNSSETFTVSTYYNKTATEWEFIKNGTFDNPPLDPLQPRTIYLPEWGTNYLEPGIYAIKANTTGGESGDANATNNEATTTINITRPNFDLKLTDFTVNATRAHKNWDILKINATIKVVDARHLNESLTSVNFSVTVTYDDTKINEGVNATKYVTTRVEQGETRSLIFYWNTTGVPTDTYNITAKATLETETGVVERKSLLYDNENSTEVIVIPGDANDDGIVDIFDIVEVSAHWTGSPPGPLGYNSDFDLSPDGAIDTSDIEICSDHWGETP